MRPLLFSIPGPVVALLLGALAAVSFLRSGLPKKARILGAGLSGVAALIPGLIYRGSSVPLHAYGAMLALAAVSAISLGAARAERAGFDHDEIVDFGIFGLLWGVVGARAFFVIEKSDLYFAGSGTGRFSPLDAIAVWKGGLVFYGGLIGAIGYMCYFILIKKRAGSSGLVRLLDLAAPCTMFGLGLGRLGCFLNGCCYGKPTGLPWRVSFPVGSILWGTAFPGRGMIVKSPVEWKSLFAELVREQGFRPPHTVGVHPTELYSSAAVFAIAAALSLVFYRSKRAGAASVAFLLAYPSYRFMVELLRGDNPPYLPSISGWMTVSQYVSLFAVACGLVWLAFMVKSARASKKCA